MVKMRAPSIAEQRMPRVGRITFWLSISLNGCHRCQSIHCLRKNSLGAEGIMPRTVIQSNCLTHKHNNFTREKIPPTVHSDPDPASSCMYVTLNPPNTALQAGSTKIVLLYRNDGIVNVRVQGPGANCGGGQDGLKSFLSCSSRVSYMYRYISNSLPH